MVETQVRSVFVDRMEVKTSDSDSDDSDIFVVKQIKPVFKTSHFIQLTLEGTSVDKDSINLENKSNVKKEEKAIEKKRRNNSNGKNPKKIKIGVSVGGDSKKATLKTKSHGKHKNNAQSTNSSEDVFVEKNYVQMAQKTIHSYFMNIKADVSLKVSGNREKVKHDSSPKITVEPGKNVDLKSHELLKVKSMECIVQSALNKEEINNFPIISSEQVNECVKTQCKLDRFSETLNENLNQRPIQGENLTVKAKEKRSSLKGFQNDFSDNQLTHLRKDIWIDHSELLCIQFKKIFNDEIEKQIAFEYQSLKSGKTVEKLILECESQVMEKFFNLKENACKVFMRMLGRKRGWHRVCMINYPGISKNLKTEFEILHKEGFIDINIEEENLKTQMELLNKPEILALCKAFKIKSNNSNSFKKESLINDFIKNSEKQKSALDMFKIENSTTRSSILKDQVKTYLGPCVRVNDRIFQIFYKILLLSSFAHYQDEEQKRFSNELFMWLQVIKNIIKFPSYKLSPTVVFETLADFEEYKNSLLLQDNFEMAINNKNHEAFITANNKAKIKFEKLLKNDEYCKRFLNLKPFLRKFSAGTVYARILTKYCKTFKKQSSNSEIESTAQLLLNQNLFLIRKKGEWYNILSKALENQKKYIAAAELIIKGLKDSVIDDVQKFSLQLRGQAILKKKTCRINDVKLRELLDTLCTSSVQDPLSVEIKGKPLEGNEAGFKCVYVEELEDGKVYTSVEEKALLYYKSKGFIKGQHSEGFIIHTIYFLLFFDIIYGISPEGVFQSPYQKAPLDLFSASFFHNRKDEIDLLLNDMLNWDNEEVETRIKDSYYKNYNTICVINWNEKFTPELFCEVTKCITVPILVLIFQRLVRNFRTFRSGFPDLTLWNPETNNCKFVEVKSSKDKLSPAQRIWLDFLKSIGLDCEVCNVKNFSCKKLRIKETHQIKSDNTRSENLQYK